MNCTMENEYRIAYAREDGSWDVVEEITARSGDDATAYAERHYGDAEWYVIDADGHNINGGHDQ